MTTYGVAIAGAGIGAAHLEGYEALAGRFEVRLICDRDRARAEALAARTGAEVCERFEEVLAHPGIDVVNICLPPYLHFETVKAGLESGRHVICEKPLFATLGEVEAMAALATASGRRFMPVLQYRFGNGFQRLLHLIRAGVTGRCFVAANDTHWNRDATYYAVPWRGARTTELGGALVGHAIHAHDLLTEALGPVRRVYARAATAVNPIETEDCAAIVFEMAAGALVTSSVTLGSVDEISRLRFCFEHVTVDSWTHPYKGSSEPWTFTPRSDADAARIETAFSTFEPKLEGFARQFELFHEALEGRGPLPVTTGDASAGLELALACYRSSRTGQPVDLPLTEAAAERLGEIA